MTDTPPGSPQIPASNDPGQGRRSFAERVTTTQGVLAIILTAVTLIFGSSGGFSAIIHHLFPASPKGPTVNQVKAALLTSSDLAAVDKNLKSLIFLAPSSASCNRDKVTAGPGFELSKEFFDKPRKLDMIETVVVFDSAGHADADFKVATAQAACGLTPGQYSSSDVSSQLNGLCDDRYALKVLESTRGVDVSYYFGMLLCSRIILFFQFQTAPRSPYDNVSNLVFGMEVAAPKLEGLT